MLTKITHVKHENNKNSTQSLGAYILMTHLPEIVNQKANILTKTKLDITLNEKSEIKSHFDFLSITSF